jgi:hypothetical protein
METMVYIPKTANMPHQMMERNLPQVSADQEE